MSSGKSHLPFILLNLILLFLVVFLSIHIELKWDSRDVEKNNWILAEGGDLVQHHFRGLYRYDPYLGWVPQDNVAVEKWGQMVHTQEDGVRSNGLQAETGGKPCILVLGDSFTFGDEVGDDQTWPAQLESTTGYQVINAGVSSYGLDQMLLRAQELVEKYDPEILIVGFIYETLERSSQSVRHGVPKPYFVIQNNQLVLRNTPVPLKKNVRLDWFREVFGKSFFIHQIMSRLFPRYWWKDTIRDIRFIFNDRMEVNRRLIDRFEELAGDHRELIFLVLAGYNVEEEHEVKIGSLLSRVFSHADKKNVYVFNLIPAFLHLKQQNPENFFLLHNMSFRDPHLSPLGNQFVASEVKRLIQTRLVF